MPDEDAGEQGRTDAPLDPEALQRELAKIRTFVYELRGLLDATVNDSPYIPADLRDDLRQAWVETEPEFDAVLADFAEHFASLELRLRPQGLIGAPLHVKLSAWR